MWVYYSVESKDLPLVLRSSIELSLLFLSSVYILRNKWKMRVTETPVLPS